jgi:hypothetical protein
MDILVGVHVETDWNDGIDAALISLNKAAIRNIFRMAKRAGKHHTITEYDYTPELGKSIIDLDTADDTSYRNIEELSAMMGDNEIFKSLQDTSLKNPVRSEIVTLHVDNSDFWWEGVFKHTDIHWETRMIPLSFLPQKLRPQTKPKQSGGPKADLNMTTEQMNAIHEKIAQGVSQGLNAREIVATFQRHVTKAQLIRCMIELIERG